MIGLGVMIKTLGGNEQTLSAIKESLGKQIIKLKLEDNNLIFYFNDETMLRIYDDGQSCCEERYMATSDDLIEFEESKLIDLELKNAPNLEDEYGEHEVQFLDIKTDKGVFQIANHNLHNGYYGGFYIVAEKKTKKAY